MAHVCILGITRRETRPLVSWKDSSAYLQCANEDVYTSDLSVLAVKQLPQQERPYAQWAVQMCDSRLEDAIQHSVGLVNIELAPV
jgi:hypothetical protein